MLLFDHMKLVGRDLCEVARFSNWLLSTVAGEVSHVAIVHEDDGSCCEREPWNDTAIALHDAIKPAVRQIFINLPEGL